mmetsp:Transcript_26686/g.47421  ORF Transcript_26686/g.47421 Transcript_26686/m.47421 type:complete len:295 (-) Transcript_26686:89-973(-)
MISWSTTSFPQDQQLRTTTNTPFRTAPLSSQNPTSLLEQKFQSLHIMNNVGSDDDYAGTNSACHAAPLPLPTATAIGSEETTHPHHENDAQGMAGTGCSSTDTTFEAGPCPNETEPNHLRTDMIRTLVQRLNQKCPNDSSEQILKTAKRLEEMLWKKAQNTKSYSDVTTLTERLRALMTIMVRRRMCDSAKRQRGQILIETLGATRYAQVRDLVKEIRLAKMKKVASLKCNGTVCGRTFSTNLPPVVRSLYFETALVQAFEKYPVERLATLDWDMLIEQAEQHLLEFKRWEAEE